MSWADLMITAMFTAAIGYIVWVAWSIKREDGKWKG